MADNDVSKGEVPLTVAFGRNREMNIGDVGRILDFDRYQKINVNAREPHEVYPSAEEMAPEKNLDFFTKCVQQFPLLRLAERDTGRVYARVENGRLMWRDSAACAEIQDTDAVRALRAVLPNPGRDSIADSQRLRIPGPDRYIVTGRWRTRGCGS